MDNWRVQDKRRWRRIILFNEPQVWARWSIPSTDLAATPRQRPETAPSNPNSPASTRTALWSTSWPRKCCRRTTPLLPSETARSLRAGNGLLPRLLPRPRRHRRWGIGLTGQWACQPVSFRYFDKGQHAGTTMGLQKCLHICKISPSPKNLKGSNLHTPSPPKRINKI